MLDVTIRYNPYKVISEIIVNGEKTKENSKLNKFLNQRFQLWVDKIPSLLVEEYNDDEFNLIFYGTDLDYQDLLSVIESAKKDKIYFKLKKMPVKEFGEKENDIRKLFEEAKKLPFEEIRSSAVSNAFELAFNELLEVNVVATMSAGKSTLINSLLGKKLMPSKQGACTATITKIQDDDDTKFKAIAMDSNKKEVEQYSSLDYKTMMELNKNPNISEIYVRGDIPFVTSEEVSLVLIDTPGPDNARDKKHGLVTAKALEESSKMLVLFVMNGGKLHDEAQDSFLKKIAKSMSVGGKQSRERFMFVINKMDAYEEEDDDIKNETIPDTIRYLEDMGIENPNIFPVAAEPALLIRRYINTNDNIEKERIMKKIEPLAQKLIDQEQLHLEKYPNLVNSCQKNINEELEEAINNNDVLGRALVHTGIRGIEETIRMYVTKYCRPAKITNVVNTFIHALDSAEAFETTKKEIASRESEHEELEERMGDLTEKIKSKSENEAFKKKISKLDISTKLTDSIDNLIVDIEVSLTEFFSECPSEMEEDEAMYYIKKFIKLASSKQDEFQVSVDRLLNEDIKLKSKQLLGEYIKKLKVLSEEFSREGLNIDLASYIQNDLVMINADTVIDDSIDSRTEYHKEYRTRTVTKERFILNPMRLFKGAYYDVEEGYTVNVEEKIIFVSREKLSNQLVAPIRKGLKEERKHIVDFSNKESKNIKDYFYKKFDEVDLILTQKTNELKKIIKTKESSRIALESANYNLKKLEEVQHKLNKILEI